MEDTAQWIHRMQQGDPTAFEPLFNAWRNPAVRAACLICGDPALAEDIAQEAFVLCLLHIGELRDPLRFRPWFYRILTRCAWDFMKKRRRLCEWSESAQQRLPAAADVYPSDHPSYEKLYRAMDKLGVKQKTTVILFYFSGLSVREIAQATSSPEATVKTRLFAARQRLRKSLKEGKYE